MADRKISELTNITGANLADDDEFALVDTSADETKAITFGEFKTALDTATGFVRITGDTMTGALDVQSTITADGLTVDGAATITTGDNTAQLTLISTDADANDGPLLVLNRNSSSPADNDKVGQIQFLGEDDASNSTIFGSIVNQIKDASNGSEDGRMSFNLISAGSDRTFFNLTHDGTQAEVVVNEDSRDIDFRVESDGSANALFVQGSSGNVGIGTSSPDLKLDVSHNVSSEYVATFQNTADNLELKIGTTSGLLNIQGANASNNTPYEIALNAEGGNVGIGTSSATQKLHVYGGGVLIDNGSSAGTIYFHDTTNYINLSGDALQFANNGSERMRISSAGNVGIGTSSPSSLLTVHGSQPIITLSDPDTGSTSTISGNSGHLILNADSGSDASNNTIDFQVDNSQKMRIDSSGHVLINNTAYSANGTLVVQQTADSKGIGIIDSAAANTFFLENDGTINKIRNNAAVPIAFETNSAERMRIAEGGNVGIGTSSPNSKLHIDQTSQGNFTEAMRISNTGGGANEGNYIQFEVSNTSGYGSRIGGRREGTGGIGLHFYTGAINSAPTEAMRIDSSGNLLVGKTSGTIASQGHELRSASNGGWAGFTNDGERVAFFNRMTNDGQIAVFRKDNVDVGSIQARGDDLVIGTGDTGIRFNDANNALQPHHATDVTDGTIDLGLSGQRFKNVFLSEGVYLGGTAATNKLDDYEDGSWTVNLYKGGSALAVTNRYGYYRRVGDLLHISFYWYNSSLTTTGTNVYSIRGMPFNLVALANAAYQFCPVGYNSIDSNNVHRWQANSLTELNMYGSASATNVSSSALELSGTGVFRI